MRLLRKMRCRLGWHKRLNVIQTFGAAQRIGCPDCGKQFAIHHGMRACVPWDAEFADLYKSMGYDTEGATTKWNAFIRALNTGGA